MIINGRKRRNKNNFFQNREKVVSTLVILIGVVFLLRLVDLQVVNGNEYREQSTKKMLRTTSIEAPRGEIYDRNGVVLATSKLGYDIYIYRTGITSKELNANILKVINILEKNKDNIVNNLPFEDGKIVYYNDKQKKNLYKVLKLEDNQEITYKEALNKLYKKYKLNEESFSDKDKLKVLAVRYETSLNQYSLFKGVKIANGISYESMAMIEEIKTSLAGIDINVTPKRYYPCGNLAAHTIGYVSSINSEEYDKNKDAGYSYNSIIGKTGIELSMEKYLKGTNGTLRREVDSMGLVTSEYVYSEAVSGNNVTLSIDYRLQTVAENALKKVINNINTGATGYKKYSDAKSGAVVALDVNTGEVLAIASYPSYDPNLFVSGISNKDWNKINNNPLNPMFNRAISGTYSPGSTYKMLTAISGLETGAITTTELIQDKGIYEYGYHPKCWIYTSYGRTHGKLNVSKAIKVSCNCFFYEVGRRVGIKDLVKYSKLFGLGSKTGIEISGEVKGSIAGEKQKTWYLGDTLSAAIGQSFNSYTPVQLANYIATLSNGGHLNRISLLKDVSNNSGDKISEEELLSYIEGYTGVKFEETSIKLNKKNVNAIVKGMESVTSETGGTSYIVFKKSNIQVAGKTGTAQVTNGNPNGIFVGFAPIKNPEIAIVAVIEHGSSGSYSANVVKPILEEYFNISNEAKVEDAKQGILYQGIVY